MSGGCPTRKREQKLQPGLLEPCALKGARTVLRGRGSGDTASLPDNHKGLVLTHRPGLPRIGDIPRCLCRKLLKRLIGPPIVSIIASSSSIEWSCSISTCWLRKFFHHCSSVMYVLSVGYVGLIFISSSPCFFGIYILGTTKNRPKSTLSGVVALSI